MAIGSRGARLLAGVALTTAAALAIAGCTSGAPAPSAASGTGSSGSAPAVDSGQAATTFAGYVAASDAAAKAGDTVSALALVTGVQWSVQSTQLTVDAATHVAPQRYSYAKPSFLLPEQSGYPRWFVASVKRSMVPAKGSHPSAGLTAGVALPAKGKVLMVFQQSAAGKPWKLASTQQLPSGQQLPALAADAAGYLKTVPITATNLLASPDVTGPLQAAVVDDGPTSAAASVVASGALTTGLYTAAKNSVMGLTPPPGDLYQWELQGTNYYQLALRTKAGGALVLYSMYLTSIVQVPDWANKNYPVRLNAPIAIPPTAAPLVSSQHNPRKFVQTQDLLAFAAIDPPAGKSAKLQIIAMGGGLATASAAN